TILAQPNTCVGSQSAGSPTSASATGIMESPATNSAIKYVTSKIAASQNAIMVGCLAFLCIVLPPSRVAAAPTYHHPRRRHNLPPSPVCGVHSQPADAEGSARHRHRIVQELIRYPWTARAKRFMVPCQPRVVLGPLERHDFGSRRTSRVHWVMSAVLSMSATSAVCLRLWKLWQRSEPTCRAKSD